MAIAAPLREMRSLSRLHLSGIRLWDVSALGALPGLVWLAVPGNPKAVPSPPGLLAALRRMVLDAGASRSEAPPGDGQWARLS